MSLPSKWATDTRYQNYLRNVSDREALVAGAYQDKLLLQKYDSIQKYNKKQEQLHKTPTYKHHDTKRDLVDQGQIPVEPVKPQEQKAAWFHSGKWWYWDRDYYEPPFSKQEQLTRYSQNKDLKDFEDYTEFAMGRRYKYIKRAVRSAMGYSRRYKRRLRRRRRKIFRRKNVYKSIKRRCRSAKRQLRKSSPYLGLKIPNYTRRTFKSWSFVTCTLGGTILANYQTYNLTLDNFITADDLSANKNRYDYIAPHCLYIQIRVIQTQNLVRTSNSSSANTLIDHAPHSYYEPNIYIYWDRIGTGSTVVGSAADKKDRIAMMPNIRQLHMGGKPIFMKYSKPTYARGRTIKWDALTLSSNIKSIFTMCDVHQQPDSLYIIWPDTQTYGSATTTALGAATFQLEIKGFLVCDLFNQTIFSAQ